VKSDYVRIISAMAVICLPALLASSHAFSYDYVPLAVGSHWEYYSTYYGEQSMTIIGEQVILGVTTRVRLQVQSDQIYESFWSNDSSGNVFIHGAINFTYPLEVAYVPPLKIVAPPLFLGKTWVTNGVRLYGLDGTPWDDEPFDYPLRVYTEGVVAVPAGSFYSYGVGDDTGSGLVLTARQGTFDVFGRRVAGDQLTAGNASDWYSDGVGVVEFCDFRNTQDPSRLVSYELPSVSTQPTTWGQLKAMFGWGGHAPQSADIQP
jgi:hypothetical protein